MPRVLYGISPIGLGHATRSFAIIQRLAKAGIELQVFSGGEAAEFLRAQGLEVAEVVGDSPPTVREGKMTWASLWYLRSWVAHRRTLPRTRKLLDRFRPDLVVCDEEFSGIVVAAERGIKRIFISDELDLGFAKGWVAGKIEARVYGWYRELQDSVDALVIPERGVDQGNRRYVGPIVREAAEGKRQILERHGLPANGRMVLLSLSGSGLGDYLIRGTLNAFRRAGLANAFLVVTGNRGGRIGSQGAYDLGVVSDNQDLIACADLVVSTAGKSTIDEAEAAGTPMIAIPIKNHAEQERNASSLGYTHEDLERLDILMAEKIGKRSVPQNFNGEEVACRVILSMLQKPRSQPD